MRLAHRLFISSAVVLLVVLAVTVANIFALTHFRAVDADVSESLAQVEALRGLRTAAEHAKVALDAYLDRYFDRDKQRFEHEGKTQLETQLRLLTALPRASAIAGGAAKLPKLVAEWEALAESDIAALVQQSGTQAKFVEMTAEIDPLSVRELAHMAEAQKIKQQSATQMDIAAWAGLVAVVAAACTTSGWLLLTIRVPLTSLAATIREMELGRLGVTVAVANRRDEIGQIGRAIDNFRQGLQETLQLRRDKDEEAARDARRHLQQQELIQSFRVKVDNLLGSVAGSRTDLERTANAMAMIAADTAKQSAAVAEASRRTSQSVSSVATTTEELSASVQEISRQIGHSATLATSAVRESKESVTIVSELNAAADEIGTVAALISGIAGQTNLLALNATIEAARAGEAGRGFAVVAGEVKQLALQTAKASAEITRRIEHIKISTTRAAQGIGLIAGRVQEISGMTSFIANAVHAQESATGVIASNVLEAASRTGDVSESNMGLSKTATSTEDAASQVLSSARELSEHFAELGHEVDQFLARVAAA